jgi:hypothetical protein
MDVTVRFAESSPAAVEAFTNAVVEASRRCGPRSTEGARRAEATTRAEVARFVDESEPEVMRLMAHSAEAAALYAYDPARALMLLGNPPSGVVLRGLGAAAERAAKNARVPAHVPIGTMTVEVDHKQATRSVEPGGSSEEGLGGEPR